MSSSRISLLLAGGALLAVTLMVPGVARAQGTDRGVNFGIKGGWVYADTRGEVSSDGDLVEFGADHGFAIGAVLVAQLHRNVSIQPEALFVRKQVTADVAGALGSLKADYFEIPVLAKLHGERRAGRAAPFALVGPTFAFLTKAEQTVEVAGISVTDDIKDEVTSVDVGLVFGGGVDFPQDWGTITVDGRYTVGLRTLDDTGEEDLKFGTFAIMGGVIF